LTLPSSAQARQARLPPPCLTNRASKHARWKKQHFPRFVIGESLLPHCMEMLEEAGFADAVRAEKGFQFKNGAAFAWRISRASPTTSPPKPILTATKS